MNDLQILTYAIQKAKKNGYRYILDYDSENDKFYVQMLDLKKYYSIIFDHEFAKAFWYQQPESSMRFLWQHHLKEMALCKEPLQYIKYYLGE